MCLRNALLKGFLCITSIQTAVVQVYLNYFNKVQGSEHPLFNRGCYLCSRNAPNVKLLIVADKFTDIKALNHHCLLLAVPVSVEAESSCA